jgi:hypothetical protein
MFSSKALATLLVLAVSVIIGCGGIDAGGDDGSVVYPRYGPGPEAGLWIQRGRDYWESWNALRFSYTREEDLEWTVDHYVCGESLLDETNAFEQHGSWGFIRQQTGELLNPTYPCIRYELQAGDQNILVETSTCSATGPTVSTFSRYESGTCIGVAGLVKDSERIGNLVTLTLKGPATCVNRTNNFGTKAVLITWNEYECHTYCFIFACWTECETVTYEKWTATLALEVGSNSIQVIQSTTPFTACQSIVVD